MSQIERRRWRRLGMAFAPGIFLIAMALVMVPRWRRAAPPAREVTAVQAVKRARTTVQTQLRTTGDRWIAEGGGAPRRALADVVAGAKTGDDRNAGIAAVLARWAPADPHGAWSWLKENGFLVDAPGETTPVTGVLQAWAVADPDGMTRFLWEAKQAGLAEADLAVAAQAAMAALVTTGHTGLARATAEQWRSGPDADAMTETSVSLVAQALAQDGSYEQAGAWLGRIGGRAPLPDATGTLAASWAERSPAAALQWAEGMPPSPARTAAITEAFAVWSSHDVDGAAAWFLAHESDPGSDALIPIFLHKSDLAATAPQAAVDWATLAKDEATRQQSLSVALAQWAERDPRAAARYLAQPDGLAAGGK